MPKYRMFAARKSKQDQMKNNLYVKFARLIYMEAKRGGPNPEANFRLKTAIANARAAQMPNENIERAIRKATGDTGSEHYEEVVYEGYAPGGIAVMVRCLTDNRNRTAAEVRAVFNRRGGHLGETGCVAYLFDEKGVLFLEKKPNQGLSEDDLTLLALECGAEDVRTYEDGYEIVTDPRDFQRVKTELEARGLSFSLAAVRWVPKSWVEVPQEAADRLEEMVEAFEALDDVQDVFHNAIINRTATEG